MDALPIEVTPTDPPSLAVIVLTQRVPVAFGDRYNPVIHLVGIQPDGRIEALMGVPSASPAVPAAPVGFSPLCQILLMGGEVAVRHQNIRRP